MSKKYHLLKILEHMRAIAKPARPAPSAGNSENPFDVFLTGDAHAINRARQEHLASLGITFTGKSALEVGAGIGLHSPFFLKSGCNVFVTDGSSENVAEIRRRFPTLRVERVDLDEESDLRFLGSFEIVYCYGLLYHLAHPESALQRLSEICTGVLLLETCVSLGHYSEVNFVKDFKSNNQATTGIGCRPTRYRVMEKLKQYFGHAYHSITQPNHHDFPLNWDCRETRWLYRAVFVGSKDPLSSSVFASEAPRQQPRFLNPPPV